MLQARLRLSGGEACCPSVLSNLGATPSGQPLDRNATSLKREAGVRRSALTRCFVSNADGVPAARSSAARTSVSWGNPELTPAAQNGAACADALRLVIRLSLISPG